MKCFNNTVDIKCYQTKKKMKKKKNIAKVLFKKKLWSKNHVFYI